MIRGAPEADLRAILRRETSTLHDSLHHHPAFSALAAGTIGPETSARLMSQLHGFYREADARIIAACDRLGVRRDEYAYAPRTPRLADWPPAGSRECGVDLPDIACRGALAGVAYVLDGALIGGAVLDRASRELPWIGGYWSWCRAEGPAIWRRTLAFVDAAGRSRGGREAAIGAALATFCAFAAWMEPLARAEVAA